MRVPTVSFIIILKMSIAFREPEEDRVYDQSCLYVRRPNDYLQYHYRLKHVQHWVPAPDERVPICSDILDIVSYFLDHDLFFIASLP